MLVTLYLISANVYNSISAPPRRGFSYIELWMIGIQVPMLSALVEYSIILGLNRYWMLNKSNVLDRNSLTNTDQWAFKVDTISFLLSILYVVIFCSAYWHSVFLL